MHMKRTSFFPDSVKELRDHIQDADTVPLLAAVAHLSGDPSILRKEWRPKYRYGIPISGLAADAEDKVRVFCAEKLLEFAKSGRSVPTECTYDEVHRFCHWMMPDVHEGYVAMVREELVSPHYDPRRPSWSLKGSSAAKPRVVIIGAGESGLLLGYRLKQAGVPFTIIEKNAGVGGTWYENSYPGCRVDCNTFFYGYAFARHIWDEYYGQSADLQKYFDRVATETGLYDNIILNAEVTKTAWDGAKRRWRVEYVKDGKKLAIECEVLVSAVGQLNRAKLPDIKGLDRFQGPAFHSALWDHSADVSGKRIGVIGTGASAMQIVPTVAGTAAKVTVLARSMPWLVPTTLLHEKVSDSMKWSLANIPTYAMWYRGVLALPGAYGMLEGVVVDPDYPPTERSVSALNEAVRLALTESIEAQLIDRPDLRDIVIPKSPFAAKRIVRDNGIWIATLKRDNVAVASMSIREVDETGIRFTDGSHEDFDILVFATGFHASQFLMPMTVLGENGADLRERWDGDDARAYMGMTVPEFPNLFILYGPNTNQAVHGGSAILWTEFSVKYVLDAIRQMAVNGVRALSVKPTVFESYSNRVDEANALRTWGFSNASSWYKNSKGRATQNFPFSSYEFWWRTHEINLADYDLKY
jgi:4-hydroxyacetophenone monooxygenase